MIQKFVRSVAELACEDYNRCKRTSAEILEALIDFPVEDGTRQRLAKVAKTLYREASSRVMLYGPDALIEAFDEFGGVVADPSPTYENELLLKAPKLSPYVPSGSYWPVSAYGRIRECFDLPSRISNAVLRNNALLEKLSAEIAAQRYYAPDVMHCSVAPDAVWRSTNEDIHLVADDGQDFYMSPHYIRIHLAERAYQSLHPDYRERPSARKIQGHSFGLKHIRGHTYYCHTCGETYQKPQTSFQDSAICSGCASDCIENETVWAVLDREPFCHAFVWVGRMPDWIFNIRHLVDIEPVWAEVSEQGMMPPSFFRPVVPTRGRISFDGEFATIGNKEVEGIRWVDSNVSDVMARALTIKGRKVRGTWVLPRAINYIAGRDPKSRYAGDNGFLPLNTYHNPEFSGWKAGKPQYTFEVEDSPLAWSLGVMQ